jgi:hypothetical protein
MAYFELDVCDLEPTELAVFRAAIEYARQNPKTKLHVLSLSDFYRMVGLPEEVSHDWFLSVIIEVMKTAVISQDYEAETLRGWPVFDSLAVKRSCIEYSVCHFAMDASEFI